jgi:hypothetical protein
MTAMSILAMAMVISLFGGYLDSPGEQRISNGSADELPNLQSQTNVTRRRS